MKLTKNQLKELLFDKQEIAEHQREIENIVKMAIKELKVDNQSQDAEDIRMFLTGDISKTELKEFLKGNY